jgi:amino acid transporter
MSATPRRPAPLRTVSPLAGLNRRRLSLVEVLAQSISAVAPSAAAVTIPAIVIARTGVTAIGVFVAATLIVVLVGYCVNQFAQRMASASGLYSYTAKGLGPQAAFTAGWSLVIGYGGAAMASALGAGIYLSALADALGIQGLGAHPAIAALIVLVAIGAALLMIRGIRLSARVSLSLEVVSIVLVLVVLGLLVASQPAPAPDAGRLPQGFRLDDAALGLVLAVVSFVGFESAGTLGAEARKPFTAVPRALFWTPVALGCLYVVAVSTQVAIFGHLSAAMLDSHIPIAELAQEQGRAGLSYMLDIGIFASWFACLMGSTNALVRIVFSMGREGVLPPALGRTHRSHGTPIVSILVAVPLIAGLPILLLAFDLSLLDVLVSLLTLSAFGYTVAYGLVCVATPVFLRRIGELTPAPLIAGVATAFLILVLVAWTLIASPNSSGGFPLVYLFLMVVGWLWLAYLARAHPERLSRIGIYDEPVVDDLLPGTFPEGT